MTGRLGLFGFPTAAYRLDLGKKVRFGVDVLRRWLADQGDFDTALDPCRWFLGIEAKLHSPDNKGMQGGDQDQKQAKAEPGFGIDETDS